MLEKLRGPFRPLSNQIARYFTWLHPNTISIVGFILGFIPVYLYLKGFPRYAGVALLVYLFDFLDGAVAKFTGKASLFGEVLDATLDRIIDALIIFALAKGGFINSYLAVITGLGFFLVSYVRARTGEAAADKKIRLDIGLAQRGERVIILMLASVFYVEEVSIPIIDIYTNSLQIVLTILALFAWETVIFRLVYAYKIFERLEYE